MRHAHAWMKLSRAVDGIDLDNVLLSALNSADLPHGTSMLCPTITCYLLSNVVIFSQLKSNMIWRGSCSTIVQNDEIDWQYPEIPLITTFGACCLILLIAETAQCAKLFAILRGLHRAPSHVGDHKAEVAKHLTMTHSRRTCTTLQNPISSHMTLETATVPSRTSYIGLKLGRESLVRLKIVDTVMDVRVHKRMMVLPILSFRIAS